MVPDSVDEFRVGADRCVRPRVQSCGSMTQIFCVGEGRCALPCLQIARIEHGSVIACFQRFTSDFCIATVLYASLNLVQINLCIQRFDNCYHGRAWQPAPTPRISAIRMAFSQMACSFAQSQPLRDAWWNVEWACLKAYPKEPYATKKQIVRRHRHDRGASTAQA